MDRPEQTHTGPSHPVWIRLYPFRWWIIGLLLFASTYGVAALIRLAAAGGIVQEEQFLVLLVSADEFLVLSLIAVVLVTGVAWLFSLFVKAYVRRIDGTRVFDRLLLYFYPYRWRIALSFVFVTIVAASAGATAYLAQPAVDRIFVSRDKSVIKWLCIAVLVIYSTKGVFRYFNAYILRSVGQRVIATLRDELYRRYQYFSIDYYNDTATGTMMSRIINDVQLMQKSVPALVDFFRQPMTLIGLAAVAIYQDWQLSVIAMVVLPISAIPIAKFGRKVRKWSKRGQQRMGNLTNRLKENFTGIRVIKAFTMEEYEIKRFSKENMKVRDALLKQIVYDELAAPVIEFLGAVAAAGVFAYGGLRIVEGTITPGQFISFLAACGMMYEPIKKLNKVNNAFQQALAAGDRIFEILDTEPVVKDKPGAYELPAVTGTVAMEGVRFGYGEETVLDGIDLVVKPGEIVALVGSSGAGKTTFVNLIPRFFDVVGGRITVDGHDLRDVTMESLRGQIAIVTQDVFLFDDSISANIAYGHLDADAAAIERAARAANAHEFILQLPRGYDTMIGEQGVRLSGGQRQRLSIARAIYKDAPILILDEATSSLDTESEREVQAALENLMRGRTTFVIAHRLSTIRNADRILVLAGGAIAEDGKHDDLIALKGIYHRLHQLQFRDE